ncbi:MAG: hypothetical protein PHN88_10450 [Ignavibacteria bacterium]|nr:hypothetical protein [Ignavibacteria bacterium]
MATIKNLGIWMDHSSANIMEFTDRTIGLKTITSDFTHDDKEQSLSKSEKMMHNKEQHEQSEYYKKLEDVIINFDEVVLFGPTEAKVELLNDLRTDNRFAKIKIVIKPADKMTQNQQHAFVRKYYQPVI